MKESETDRHVKIVHVHGLGELTFLNCAYYLDRLIYRLNTICIKIPMAFFKELK